MPRPTVVSAYYTIPSKFPPAQYISWIKDFLSIPCQLIFFTQPDLIPLLTSLRPPELLAQTLFVELPWDELDAPNKVDWHSQWLKDPESAIHSPELYAIWYAKKEFVLRAATLSPWGLDNSHYLWCDAGSCRVDSWLPILQNPQTAFPREDRFPANDNFFLLEINPFTNEERSRQTILGPSKDHIGGGFLGGTLVAWQKWSTTYDEMLNRYLEKGLFVGKDQIIMSSIVLENPELIQLVPTNHLCEDAWFWPLLYFSGVDAAEAEAEDEAEDEAEAEDDEAEDDEAEAEADSPLISILIPLYNGIEFLPVSLASVREQTYTNWEVLIGVNGLGSNSKTLLKAQEIVRILDNPPSQRIHVIDLPNVNGKSEALNALVLSEAKGSWIAVLDVDDLWLPQKLEIQLKMLTVHFAYDVIGTACSYFGDLHNSPQIPLGDLTGYDFLKGNPIINSSSLIRKKLANWNPENRILEDYELWLTLWRNGVRFYNCPEVLVGHRIHGASHFNGRNSGAVDELLKRFGQK